MTSSLEETYSAPVPQEPPDTGNHPKIALAVAAHPDDAEFGCAGTAYLWTQQGWTFYQLICTDGSKGTDDPNIRPEELIQIRRKEQRAAAAVQGVKDVFFLEGYVDGELQYSRQLLGDIVRYIRMLKPYAVFTHDPTQIIVRNSFINHSDHRNVGLATVDAVYPTARDRWNFPEQIAEGLEPHNVREIFIWGSDEPNFVVDITDVLEMKIQALLRHESQSHAKAANEGDTGFLEFIKQRWRTEEGRYLERFRRVSLVR